MLRAAVFSIAFAVATGHSLPTLCQAWCATQAAGSGCHHGGGGGIARVEQDSSCQDRVPLATLQREDTRRRTAFDAMTTVWWDARSTARLPLPQFRFLGRPNSEQSAPRSILQTPLRI